MRLSKSLALSWTTDDSRRKMVNMNLFSRQNSIKSDEPDFMQYCTQSNACEMGISPQYSLGHELTCLHKVI